METLRNNQKQILKIKKANRNEEALDGLISRFDTAKESQ